MKANEFIRIASELEIEDVLYYFLDEHGNNVDNLPNWYGVEQSEVDKLKTLNIEVIDHSEMLYDEGSGTTNFIIKIGEDYLRIPQLFDSWGDSTTLVEDTVDVEPYEKTIIAWRKI